MVDKGDRVVQNIKTAHSFVSVAICTALSHDSGTPITEDRTKRAQQCSGERGRQRPGPASPGHSFGAGAALAARSPDAAICLTCAQHASAGHVKMDVFDERLPSG